MRCAPVAAPRLATPQSTLAPSGSITLLDQQGGGVLVLSGEIDVGTVQAFEMGRGGRGPTSSPTTFVAVADVTAVTFIGSCGLLLLVRCTHAARASGRRPILRGAGPPVQRILSLTGLGALFDTDPPHADPRP